MDFLFLFGPGLVSSAAAAPNPHRKAFIWDWFQSTWAGVWGGGAGGWFPSGAQDSFSIRLIRGSLAPLHTMTLPCSQARIGTKENTQEWIYVQSRRDCALHLGYDQGSTPTPQRCFSERSSSLCYQWPGWDDSGVSSPGTILRPVWLWQREWMKWMERRSLRMNAVGLNPHLNIHCCVLIDLQRAAIYQGTRGNQHVTNIFMQAVVSLSGPAAKFTVPVWSWRFSFRSHFYNLALHRGVCKGRVA